MTITTTIITTTGPGDIGDRGMIVVAVDTVMVIMVIHIMIATVVGIRSWPCL